MRGVDTTVHDKLYKGFREPDLVFHCVCPIEVAFSRLINDKGMSYYGSGMDLHLSNLQLRPELLQVLVEIVLASERNPLHR